MTERASAGHKLGQLVGDWFEEYYVLPLLTQAAQELRLFLDNRFIERSARGDRILWKDIDGNEADYDFVLELGGTNNETGIPVGFVESFWRRGARHSKDKARDDSGKLMPMRDTYPTARFLGIVAAGAFTQPASELVRNRGIDLFLVPKSKVVAAFQMNGLEMDYPDRASEAEKQRIASAFEQDFREEKKRAVTASLINLQGVVAVRSYVDRVRARLSALPQEIRFVLRQDSSPYVFDTVVEASEFLQKPFFQMDSPVESYLYQVTYSDGSEYEAVVPSLEELKTLHGHMARLADHMNRLS
jgi:hypothetical protein